MKYIGSYAEALRTPEDELCWLEATGRSHVTILGTTMPTTHYRQLKADCDARAIRQDMLARGHIPAMRDPSICSVCGFQLPPHPQKAA